jgi:response regulator of citrate/malate metabolism
VTAVFVVEDEPLAAEAHGAIVDRLPGFGCSGRAGSVAGAVAALTGPARQPADIVLLDLHLPDGNGLEVVARLRQEGLRPTVLAVTADRDLRAVKGALGAGVADYLLKPFTAAVLEAKLTRAVAARAANATALDQRRIDRAFETLHAEAELQKGMQQDTLALVRRALAGGAAASATEVANAAALSRPTARRYLEHLVAIGEVERRPRYGQPGRPEHEYRLH